MDAIDTAMFEIVNTPYTQRVIAGYTIEYSEADCKCIIIDAQDIEHFVNLDVAECILRGQPIE